MVKGGKIQIPYFKPMFSILDQLDGTASSFDVTTNIEAGKSYVVRVYAENSIGISEDAAESEAITLPEKVRKRKEERLERKQKRLYKLR